MAKDKKKKESGKNIEALDILFAKTYGISPDFIKQNEKLIDDTRKIFSDKLSPKTQINDSSSSNSNVQEYLKILTSSMNTNERLDLINSLKQNDARLAPSGSHSVLDNSGVVDKLSDTSVVEELMSDIRNHFTLMPEYSKVCEIIPELGKCVEIIVKDIINRDEFTHSFITNFYNDSVDTEKKTEAENRIKDLLKEYDFEGKMRKWIKDAEVSGVKPFSILPQDDVIHIINMELQNHLNSNKTFESFDVENSFDVKTMLKPSPLERIYPYYDKVKLGLVSTESADYKKLSESLESDSMKFADSIVTNDIVDRWVDICLEEFRDKAQEQKLSLSNNAAEYTKFYESVESFEENIGKVQNQINKHDTIKKELKDLIVCFDKSIEVVEPLKAPLYQVSKKLKNNNLYKNVDYMVEKGVIDDFYRVNDIENDSKGKGKDSKSFNIDGFELELSRDPIDNEERNKRIKNKRAILTEYEPEHVIPIAFNGTHVGYYVVEFVRTSGDNFLLLKKDKGSFMDMLRRMGVGEDKALVANTGTTAVDSVNPFNSGAFSPSTIMTPIINGAMTPYSGMRYGGLGGVSSRKTELIKTILIKTISKRLGDESLADDGMFQSSLMNLIRDDIIYRNNIRFTFIPESHMVYMSRELNGDGYPLSIFDGTLFNCYIYIASLISSMMMKVMKSSDTEVMEVNVGKSKELGLTVGAISQNASTRNVSARTLFGGTDSIVRSVGNFKRLIIPVVNGEKLFDVARVENANEVNIDDDFTGRNLKSVVMKIGVPPTSLDMMSQDEYVASQTQHRLDYRTLIIDRGVNYAKFITKAIKLIVHYSDISLDGKDQNDKERKDEVNDIDISKIEFKFALPKSLTVNKVTEELNNIITLVDALIGIYYGSDNKDSEEWQAIIRTTRKNLMKELSSSTDWSSIETIIENSLNYAKKEFLEESKLNKPSAPIKDEGNGNNNTGDSSDTGDMGGDISSF